MHSNRQALAQVRVEGSPTCSQETKQDSHLDKVNNDIVQIEYNNENSIDQPAENEPLQQRGFKKSALGYVMMVYMAIISVFWIIILLVLCLDYYGYVSRKY
jgi:hypothetical protein